MVGIGNAVKSTFILRSLLVLSLIFLSQTSKGESMIPIVTTQSPTTMIKEPSLKSLLASMSIASPASDSSRVSIPIVIFRRKPGSAFEPQLWPIKIAEWNAGSLFPIAPVHSPQGQQTFRWNIKLNKDLLEKIHKTAITSNEEASETPTSHDQLLAQLVLRSSQTKLALEVHSLEPSSEDPGFSKKTQLRLWVELDRKCEVFFSETIKASTSLKTSDLMRWMENVIGYQGIVLQVQYPVLLVLGSPQLIEENKYGFVYRNSSDLIKINRPKDYPVLALLQKLDAEGPFGRFLIVSSPLPQGISQYSKVVFQN